jgi:glutamine synthetase
MRKREIGLFAALIAATSGGINREWKKNQAFDKRVKQDTEAQVRQAIVEDQTDGTDDDTATIG